MRYRIIGTEQDGYEIMDRERGTSLHAEPIHIPGRGHALRTRGKALLPTNTSGEGAFELAWLPPLDKQIDVECDGFRFYQLTEATGEWNEVKG